MPEYDVVVEPGWWNWALVDVLFPKGSAGTSRLYLNSGHLDQLRDMLNRQLADSEREELVATNEELLTHMYTAAGGIFLVHDCSLIFKVRYFRLKANDTK